MLASAYARGDNIRMLGKTYTVYNTRPFTICDDLNGNLQEITDSKHFSLITKLRDSDGTLNIGKRVRKPTELLVCDAQKDYHAKPVSPTRELCDNPIYTPPSVSMVEACMLDVHMCQQIKNYCNPSILIKNTRIIETLGDFKTTFYVEFDVPVVYKRHDTVRKVETDSQLFDVILLNDGSVNDLELLHWTSRMRPGGYIGWCSSYELTSDYMSLSIYTCRSMELENIIVFPLMCRNERMIMYCSGQKL